MANFQGNRINPTRFSSGQIKFHIIAFPLSIFMILPVVFLIGNAFKPLGELFKFPPTIFAHNPTLDNFKNLMNLAGSTGIPMSRYFLNSMIVTVLTVVLNLLITIMAAYVFSKKKFKIKGALWEINQSGFNPKILNYSKNWCIQYMVCTYPSTYCHACRFIPG